MEALAGFVPQVAGLAALGAALHRDLAAACLAQTWAFVMLNKVCTVQVRRLPRRTRHHVPGLLHAPPTGAQYFVWYFALVAIALPPRAAALRRVAAPTLAWAAAMVRRPGRALLRSRGANPCPRARHADPLARVGLPARIPGLEHVPNGACCTSRDIGRACPA